MVHPVKTPLGLVRGATRLSVNAVRHPVHTAGEAFTVGRTLVGAVVTGHRPGATPSRVADDVERPVAVTEPEAESAKKQGDPVTPAATETTGSRGTTRRGTKQTGRRSPGTGGAEASAAAPSATESVVTEPAVTEPIVTEPIVTEPSAVTAPGDDDEIPSPAVQPVDEDVEVITPVGTTGAGPAVNPDTTESDLQQPGTEPLMDPSTTKRIKKETETLRKASDRQK